MVDFSGLNKIADNIGESFKAVGKNTGAGLTGAAVGAGKSLVDVAALPVTVGASVLGHLTGNEDLRKTYDNYSHFFYNPRNQSGLSVDAYKALSGKQTLTPEEMQAIAAGQTISEVVTPGLAGKMLPGVKGGAIGAGGAVLSKADEVLGLPKVRSAVAKAIPDDLVKGASNMYDVASSKVKGIKENEVTNSVISQFNPRSATERVIAEGGDAFNILKKQLDAPEAANLKDLGVSYLRKYGALPDEQGLQLIENTLKKNKVNPEAIALIKNELNSALISSKKTESFQYAKQSFNDQVSKIGRKDMIPDETQIIDSASNLATFYTKDINKNLAQGKFDTAKLLESELPKKLESIYNTLAKKNSKIANKWADSYNPALTSFISRFSMMLNPGAAMQDVVSFQLNSRNSALAVAQSMGIDDFAKVERNITPFFKKDKWLENPANAKLIEREIINPTRDIMSGFDPLVDTRIVKDTSKVKNIIRKSSNLISKLFEDALYGVQQGTREKLIESAILPKAIGIARATPGLIEGTEKFNKAVVNISKEMLRKNTMLKETKKYTQVDSFGNIKVTENWETQLANKLAEMPGIGKEGKAAANTLLGWTSNQMRAFNAAPDTIGDVLNRVKKTGKVTAIDKQQLVQSFVDIGFSLAMFGARGLRLAGMGMTIPKAVYGGNEMDTSKADQTLPSLIINGMAELFDTDPNIRQQFLNGVIGNWTGSVPAAGLLNAPDPFTRLTLGFEIATSKGSSISKGLTNTIPALLNGDIKTAIDELFNVSVSRDIKGMIQSKAFEGTGNEIVNSKGQSLTDDFARNNNLTENTQLGKDALALLKLSNTPAIGDGLNPKKAFVDYTLDKDNKIIDKYSKYTIEQFKENKQQFAKDIEKFDPETQESIAERIVEKMVENKTSSQFRSLRSKAGDYLKLTTTELHNMPEIKSLTTNQLGELLGYAALANSEGVGELLARSGKINKENLPEIRKIAKKLIEKKKGEKEFALLRKMNNEKEAPVQEEIPEPAPAPQIDEDDYVDIGDYNSNEGGIL